MRSPARHTSPDRTVSPHTPHTQSATRRRHMTARACLFSFQRLSSTGSTALPASGAAIASSPHSALMPQWDAAWQTSGRPQP
eukprot:6342648-Prymnesium_polylepis.1